MNTPLRIEITDDAATQIASAVAWWTEHRPTAPGAVLDDLDRILDLLCVQPAMGTRARRASLSGVRRVTLSRIRYYVYYRVVDDALQVLALWHTSRGRGPIL
ncbi:MAG: type II toxin-antitoxin system RelE/ParE family toxin [Planctomycetota bacterium]